MAGLPRDIVYDQRCIGCGQTFRSSEARDICFSCRYNAEKRDIASGRLGFAKQFYCGREKEIAENAATRDIPGREPVTPMAALRIIDQWRMDCAERR